MLAKILFVIFGLIIFVCGLRFKSEYIKILSTILSAFFISWGIMTEPY